MTLLSFPLNLMEMSPFALQFTVNKIMRMRWHICDVVHKHSCTPRTSPLENFVKSKHIFISCVGIEIILLYDELSLINL